MSEKTSRLVLGALIVGYVVVFGVLASFRHHAFETQASDMGIFEQTFWNTVHGEIMQNTLEEAPNHLGVHMSPTLFLLVLGFVLFQSPYFLLLIQTLALALGAIPLFLLAFRLLQSPRSALLLAGAYLLYPSLHFVNLFDFHEIAFFVPLMLSAFYFLETRRWLWAWGFLLLAAGTKEDAIIAVAFVGIWLLIKKAQPVANAEPSGFFTPERKHGIALLLLSILYFVIAVKFVMPALGGGLLRLDRYAELGSTPFEIITHLVQNPSLFFVTVFTANKLAYAFWLFLPLAFIPFLAVCELLLLIPGLLENMLTAYGPQFSSLYQYDAILIPAIFIAAVYGLKIFRTRWPMQEQKIFYALCVTIVIAFLIRSPLSPRSFPTDWFRASPRAEAYRTLIKKVPPKASVAANTNIVPHLSNRKEIYILGREPFSVDAVLIDGADPFGFKDMEAFQSYADAYALSGEYSVRSIDDRYFLFLRKNPETL